MTIAIRHRGRLIPVEHRTLPASGRRLKPKPDSAAVLRGIAAELRDMPRECARDRTELLLWLSRTARQLDSIALDGFEASAMAVTARQPARPRFDAKAAAEAVFGRKLTPVKVEVRRRSRTAGQTCLFPELDEVSS